MTNRPTSQHIAAAVGVDRLSALLERFRVRTHLFFSGELCGLTHFAAQPGHGFLHVMREGEMLVTHRAAKGLRKRVQVSEPSLLFYPRPLAHDFHNAPKDGADFVCATVRFDGGGEHPLARALPPVVILPLAQVPGLSHTLALLFAETQRVLCGQRLVADRLFEVLLLQLLRWLIDHPPQNGWPLGLLAGLQHPQLAKALSALHERPSEDWSLERMAACAGMSRSAFAAAFRTYMDTTPADYLAQWRLTIARTQLQEGKGIKAIAQDLGYGSASALSRVFTQKTGQSPRDWLKTEQAAGL
jgi:AraC-like DNA-binding protein